MPRFEHSVRRGMDLCMRRETKKREEKRHSYCVILGVRPDHTRIHIESNVGECDVYVGGKVGVAKFMMF